jgi:hypothetical protein
MEIGIEIIFLALGKFSLNGSPCSRNTEEKIHALETKN